MIPKKEIDKVLAGYENDSITIGTIGSHSALQILKGAKDEGFDTLAICTKDRAEFYKDWNFIDNVLVIGSYKDILKKNVQEKLIKDNVILIPHGSFVEYVTPKSIEEKLYTPLFGNRSVLHWESDRRKGREWFNLAGIKIPKEFSHPSEIDRIVIVKFPGAKGGRGYFLARNEGEFNKKIKGIKLTMKEKNNFTIQEYIIGTRFYLQFFYSPIIKKVELLGIDIRYESNIDGLVRIPSYLLAGYEIEPGYVVTGNIPVVVRESLLPRIMEIGNNIVGASKRLFPPGIIGPFCMETVCTEDMNFVSFEISARIVAGTNLYLQGSPYSQLLYDEPMSTGRRIAREIKMAVDIGKLAEVIY